MSESEKPGQADASRDPMTGEAGAHPLGVGIGSAGGAMVGAVVGSVAGPVGTALGAAIGGVAGGLTGKGLAEGNAWDRLRDDADYRQEHI